MKTWHLTQLAKDGIDNGILIQNGLIKLDSDIDAVRTRIDCALQIVKGELDDQNLGVDYFGIIYSRLPIEFKVQELTRVISSVEGVSDVKLVSAMTRATTGELIFNFRITTVYGELDYERTFENI